MDNNNPVEAPNEDLEDVYNEEDFTYVGDVEDFLDELEGNTNKGTFIKFETFFIIGPFYLFC